MFFQCFLFHSTHNWEIVIVSHNSVTNELKLIKMFFFLFFSFLSIGEFIWDKSRPGQFPDVVFGSEEEDFLPDFESYEVKNCIAFCGSLRRFT